MTDATALVGSSCLLDADDEPPAELLFRCVSSALRDAGLRKADVGATVIASRDLYDACSMSNGQTMPAAGSWQVPSATRLETDFAAAFVLADAILRRRDTDVALVAAVHHPQVPASEHAGFDGLATSLSAEPLYERPAGMTADAILALHASRLVALGKTTPHALAVTAAREITAGAPHPRATRPRALGADDVLASDVVAWPLTQLMLPAPTAGAVAVVLATPERARTLGRARARLVAHGMSASGGLGAGDWLDAPENAARRAAAIAYRRAGLTQPAEELDVAEISAASPALREPLREALGLGGLADERISPSGGVRSSFPGVANGGLRLLEAVDWLERNDGRRALVHSVDTLSGLLGANTVTLLERP